MNEIDIFPKSYQYKPNTIKMLLAIGFFSLCSLVLFHIGQTTQTPKLINIWHIFRFQLSAPQAQVFFYGLSLVSLIFVFCGLYALFRNFRSTQEILITTTSISHIKNHQILKEIPIKDISKMDFSEVHISSFTKNCHITILYPQGKMVISDQLLENKKYLIEIYEALQYLHSKIQSK